MEKEPKLARWIWVWMLFQLVPAPRVPVVLLERVISQLAWWLESGPQAGEKFTAERATPATEAQLGPLQPAKLTAPTTDWPVVSSIQNLTVIWERFKAVEPLLTTSKFSEAWLPFKEVNSSNCRSAALVPQAELAVGVAVAVGVNVEVATGVRVKEGLKVGVLETVEVAVLGDVEVGVKVADGVEVEVTVLVEVEVDVAETTSVRVGLDVGV